MYGYIYKITNKLNSKIYIGKHKYDIDDGELDSRYTTSGVLINKSINKHGKENFNIEIIDRANDLYKLNSLEKYYIKELDCRHPKGYNLTDGGDGAPNLDAESRAKMAVWKGKKQPKEMVDKRMAWQLETPRTDEWNNNISLGLKNSEKAKAQHDAYVKARADKYRDTIICTDGNQELLINKDDAMPEGFIKMKLSTFKGCIEKFGDKFDDISSYIKDHSARSTAKYFNISRLELNRILEIIKIL